MDIEKEVLATLTPDEAVRILRSAGVKIGAPTLRDGIDQGRFPFGFSIDAQKRVFLISKKLLAEWLESFCGVTVTYEQPISGIDEPVEVMDGIILSKR